MRDAPNRPGAPTHSFAGNTAVVSWKLLHVTATMAEPLGKIVKAQPMIRIIEQTSSGTTSSGWELWTIHFLDRAKNDERFFRQSGSVGEVSL